MDVYYKYIYIGKTLSTDCKYLLFGNNKPLCHILVLGCYHHRRTTLLIRPNWEYVFHWHHNTEENHRPKPAAANLSTLWKMFCKRWWGLPGLDAQLTRLKCIYIYIFTSWFSWPTKGQVPASGLRLGHCANGRPLPCPFLPYPLDVAF